PRRPRELLKSRSRPSRMLATQLMQILAVWWRLIGPNHRATSCALISSLFPRTWLTKIASNTLVGGLSSRVSHHTTTTRFCLPFLPSPPQLRIRHLLPKLRLKQTVLFLALTFTATYSTTKQSSPRLIQHFPVLICLETYSLHMKHVFLRSMRSMLTTSRVLTSA
ncbi:hypothetical protein FBU31_001171, partial [Coemansia sp. 'formosensis']